MGPDISFPKAVHETPGTLRDGPPSEVELGWRRDALCNDAERPSLFAGTNKRRAGLVGGPAGRCTPHPYRHTAMAEHPESDPSVERLVSVLIKSVMADGPARRYALLWIDYKKYNQQRI